MKYSFKDFKSDLEIGHEFHFLYKEKEYSISHTQHGWHLSEYYKDYQTFETAVELLEKAYINGLSLKDIWVDIEVKNIF
ncbi:hypothetical protein [Fictibacillus barbaricus]|uniref:DNA-binding ferritin-like protein (Dps family) n=1 Tax=Fictibacillus barbaricus TaxID=182136 RepID=A0ABU1TWQ9_9BACL|nr:hypothetical protein [Fictibacillus barbaricus]MDR7071643.1 DNA-binding ferritin-like protein (Dps family) [Fictibacillus barbaricus]